MAFPWALVAAALAAWAFTSLFQQHAAADLAPRATAWGATVAALLGYQGFHLAVMAILAAVLVTRVAQGLVTPRQRATRDNVALLWHGACAQGVVVALLPHATAWVMG